MLLPQLNSTLMCESLSLIKKIYLLLFAWRKAQDDFGRVPLFFEKYFKLQMRDECSGKGCQRTGWVLLRSCHPCKILLTF